MTSSTMLLDVTLPNQRSRKETASRRLLLLQLKKYHLWDRLPGDPVIQKMNSHQPGRKCFFSSSTTVLQEHRFRNTQCMPVKDTVMLWRRHAMLPIWLFRSLRARCRQKILIPDIFWFSIRMHGKSQKVLNMIWAGIFRIHHSLKMKKENHCFTSGSPELRKPATATGCLSVLIFRLSVTGR